MGSWKKPIAERGPKVSTAISEPAMMMSHGMGRLAAGAATTDGVDMVRLRD
jgi:hypothetical protein